MIIWCTATRVFKTSLRMCPTECLGLCVIHIACIMGSILCFLPNIWKQQPAESYFRDYLADSLKDNTFRDCSLVGGGGFAGCLHRAPS
jgi:hypothetical protein